MRYLFQKGFSLIEIAIVLVVVGLLISGGLVGLAPVLQSNRVSQTNAQMDRIEQALVLYVIQNGCLPCPAVPAALTGRATDSAGAYSTGCGDAAGTCTAPGVTLGIVPWVNLGLAREDVIDAYGAFIDYAPATGLNLSNRMVRTPPSTYPAPAAGLQVESADGTRQTLNALTSDGAAYVLISHGQDGSFGYTPAAGTPKNDPNGSILQSCNSLAQATCGAPITGNAYVQSTAQTNAAGANLYFDDIVRFKTAPVIIQACGSNACGNPS